jgi:Predicted hydrolases or acyltransferases (alpha/beta hydrolase superfamily)
MSASLLNNWGLKDIIIVGHDWGMAIGLQYARSHPENVRGMPSIIINRIYTSE